MSAHLCPPSNTVWMGTDDLTCCHVHVAWSPCMPYPRVIASPRPARRRSAVTSPAAYPEGAHQPTRSMHLSPTYPQHVVATRSSTHSPPFTSPLVLVRYRNATLCRSPKIGQKRSFVSASTRAHHRTGWRGHPVVRRGSAGLMRSEGPTRQSNADLQRSTPLHIAPTRRAHAHMHVCSAHAPPRQAGGLAD